MFVLSLNSVTLVGQTQQSTTVASFDESFNSINLVNKLKLYFLINKDPNPYIILLTPNNNYLKNIHKIYHLFKNNLCHKNIIKIFNNSNYIIENKNSIILFYGGLFNINYNYQFPFKKFKNIFSNKPIANGNSKVTGGTMGGAHPLRHGFSENVFNFYESRFGSLKLYFCKSFSGDMQEKGKVNLFLCRFPE